MTIDLRRGIVWAIASVLVSGTSAMSQPIIATWNAQIREVIDQRSSDPEASDLEVQLRMSGPVPEGVRRIQTRLLMASDDTGKNLLAHAKENDWEDFRNRDTGTFNLDLKFKNPARGAEKIPKITGEIDLFVPRLDPACIFAVPLPKLPPGKLAHPVLEANGIKLTVWTAKQYRALAPEDQELPVDDVEDNSLIIKAEDENGRLAEVEFLEADGRKINIQDQTREFSTTGYDFRRPLRVDTQLRFSIATDLATVTVPLRLTNLPVP